MASYPYILKTRSQRGISLIFNALIMGALVVAMGVLGIGQVVFEKGQLQKQADILALQAAKQISNGPEFQIAMDMLELNNVTDDTQVSVVCLLNGSPSPGTCEGATTVRATLIKPNNAFWIANDRPVTAVAEATLTPVVIGTVKSGLISVSTQQSALLNGLLSTILPGTAVNLSAATYEGLLNLNTNVDLLALSTQLGVASVEELAGLNITALELLEAAGHVVDQNGGPVLELPEPLGDVLEIPRLTVGDILAVDLSGSSRGVLGVNLGQLIQTTLLAATKDAAVDLPLSLGLLGVTAQIKIIEPPQIFVGRKMEGVSPVAKGRTAQVQVDLSVNGLPETNLGIPGLINVRVSGLNLGVSARVAGGYAEVEDVECRLPRADNLVQMKVQPSLAEVCVALPEDEDSDVEFCEEQAKVLDLNASLLGLQLVNLPVNAFAQADVNDSPSYFDLEGEAPMSMAVPGQLGGILANALGGINLQLSIGGDLSFLNSVLGLVLNSLDNLLSPILQQVGALLDSLLSVLGITLNEVQVDISGLDCKSAIITY